MDQLYFPIAIKDTSPFKLRFSLFIIIVLLKVKAETKPLPFSLCPTLLYFILCLILSPGDSLLTRNPVF